MSWVTQLKSFYFAFWHIIRYFSSWARSSFFQIFCVAKDFKLPIHHLECWIMCRKAKKKKDLSWVTQLKWGYYLGKRYFSSLACSSFGKIVELLLDGFFLSSCTIKMQFYSSNTSFNGLLEISIWAIINVTTQML